MFKLTGLAGAVLLLGTCAQAAIIVSEDFDDGVADGFTFAPIAGDQLWHLTGNSPSSAPSALGYLVDASGNYNTGERNASDALTPLFFLPTAPATLAFSLLMDVEPDAGFDEFFVFVGDGVTFTQIADKSAFTNDGLYQNYVFDISSFGGQTVQVVFRFDTGDALFNDTAGIRIDNLTVDSAVPEPATFVLVAAGVVLALVRRRRSALVRVR